MHFYTSASQKEINLHGAVQVDFFLFCSVAAERVNLLFTVG